MSDVGTRTGYGAIESSEPSEGGTGDISESPEEAQEQDLEDIYDYIGLGRGQYYTWGALMLVQLMDMSELVLISILIQYLRCEWDLTFHFELLISSSVFGCYAIGGMVFGRLSDTIGRRHSLLIATWVLLFASLSSALSINKWMFLVSRVIAGFCIGAHYPITAVYSAEIAPAGYREYGLALVTAVSKCSVFIISLEALIFLNSLGWRGLILITCGPIFLAGLALCFIPESPKFLLANGRNEDAKKALKRYYEWNGKEFPEDLKLKPFATDSKGEISDVLATKYRKETILLSMMYAGNIFIKFGLIVFLPFALTDEICGGIGHPEIVRDCTHMTQDHLIDLTIITGSVVIAMIVGTAIAKSFKRFWPIKISAILNFIAVVGLLFCINMMVTKALFFIVKFLLSVYNMLVWVVLCEFYPTVFRNTATGFINMWGKGAGAVATFLVYILYTTSPLAIVMLFIHAAFVSMLAGVLWDTETKDMDSERADDAG